MLNPFDLSNNIKQEVFNHISWLLILILFHLISFFRQIKLISIITIFPRCLPRRTQLIENFPHTILNESISYQKKFNELKQVHIHEGKVFEPIWFYETSLVREYTILRHLQNVFVSSSKVISTERALLRFWNTEENPFKYLDTSNEVYFNVIYLYSIWGEVFGHFFHDSLPMLLLMPDDIVNKSLILLQYYPDAAFVYTDLLSYPRDKFIYYPNTYIFAKNLYMITPIEDRNGLQIVGFPLLRKKLRKKLEVNSIKPEKYALSNRDGFRHLHNFNEVVEAIKTTFPNISWEVLTIPYDNITQCSKLIASFKIWFSPCGSNINNAVYMQKNTGICLVMANWVDLPNYAVAYMCDLWAIGFNNEFPHHDYWGGKCSISLAIKALEKLLIVIEKGEWPLIDNFFHPFNITRTKQKMNGNMKTFFKATIVEDHIE